MTLSNNSYYECLKNLQGSILNSSAQMALERTFEHFKIPSANRETMIEALLRLAVLMDEQEVVAKDDETKKLFEILAYFKQELHNES